MGVKTNKLNLGLNGTYSGNTYVTINSAGEMVFKDAVSGEMTLAELLASEAEHAITDHTGLDLDFATQYYNTSRLATYIADAAKGNTVGISGDVGGHGTLGDHVADAAIHQRVPKFVLRVAKGGQSYSTITAALAAIPTVGADAPAPDQWWRVEVSPGVYNEAVLLDKQWVEICGAGAETTRIEFDNSAAAGSYPLYVAASNVAVRDIGIVSTNPTVASNVALLVGGIAGGAGIVSGVAVQDCGVETPGEYALWLSTDSGAELSGCEVTSIVGAACMVKGSGTFSRCFLTSGDGGETYSRAIRCDGATGELFVFNCRSSKTLLALINSTVKVVGCAADSLVGSENDLLAHLTGNVMSTVYWDGAGLVGPPSTLTTVTINRLPEADWYTDESALVYWGPNSSESALEFRTFKAGHTGSLGVPFSGIFGDTEPEFQFFRNVQFSDATITGDVFSLGDSSNAGSGTNDTNALALYLGINNDSGKFLRWVNGLLGAGTELGYIDRDGKMRTPGVHSDEYKSADGSAGLTRDVVAYDTDGTTPVTMTFKNGLLVTVV